MAHIFEKDGRRTQAYGVRLSVDWSEAVPEQMLLMNVPEAEYIVFEHGAFDYEQESISVGGKLERAMKSFSFSDTDYKLDEAAGRIAFFYHDPEQFEKWIRPVIKKYM